MERLDPKALDALIDRERHVAAAFLQREQSRMTHQAASTAAASKASALSTAALAEVELLRKAGSVTAVSWSSKVDRLQRFLAERGLTESFAAWDAAQTAQADSKSECAQTDLSFAESAAASAPQLPEPTIAVSLPHEVNRHKTDLTSYLDAALGQEISAVQLRWEMELTKFSTQPPNSSPRSPTPHHAESFPVQYFSEEIMSSPRDDAEPLTLSADPLAASEGSEAVAAADEAADEVEATTAHLLLSEVARLQAQLRCAREDIARLGDNVIDAASVSVAVARRCVFGSARDRVACLLQHMSSQRPVLQSPPLALGRIGSALRRESAAEYLPHAPPSTSFTDQEIDSLQLLQRCARGHLSRLAVGFAAALRRPPRANSKPAGPSRQTAPVKAPQSMPADSISIPSASQTSAAAPPFGSLDAFPAPQPASLFLSDSPTTQQFSKPKSFDCFEAPIAQQGNNTQHQILPTLAVVSERERSILNNLSQPNALHNRELLINARNELLLLRQYAERKANDAIAMSNPPTPLEAL